MSGELQAVLTSMLKALDHAGDTETALRAVVDAAVELTPAEHASIRVLDARKRQLLPGARTGDGATTAPGSLRRGVGIAGWVVDTGQPVRLDDCREDPRFKPIPGQGFDVRSILATPILREGQAAGVLALTASGVGAFGPAHEPTGQLLAGVAGLALERYRLEYQSLTDEATGAYTARYLEARLAEECERSARHDLDFCLLGVEVRGEMAPERRDDVLHELSARLRSSLRCYDVAARLDDAALCLVLPSTALEGAQGVQQRLVRELQRSPLSLARFEASLQLSWAIAAWQRDERGSRVLERLREAIAAGGGTAPGGARIAGDDDGW